MKTFFTSLLLLITFVATAQNKLNEKTNLPGHPRLLLLNGEEEKIKSTISSNPLLKQVHLGILARCDQFLNEVPVKRIKIGIRLLDKSRTCLERVFYLSYAWRMTHQQKYLERAEKEMLAAAAFENWNPSHFLDVAEMTMALAIGYDWLYQDLSADSRTLIKTAIITKGLQPSMENGSNLFWIKAAHNWNQVCNAGLSFGALAIYEEQPVLAGNIINRAMNTIDLPMKIYEPDGAYPEGYIYWNYGTTFNVLLIDAVQKVFGSEFNFSDKPGFLKTAGFMQNMTGPTGQPFNYFDSSTKGELNPAMFWFAAKLKNPSLLFNELAFLEKNSKKNIEDRLLPTLLIWSGGMQLDKIDPPEAHMWVGKGINPVAMMRSSWTDPNAIYVGLKGGSPSINHGHMDIGSFVMEADGVRWASDFGMQGYESLESNGIDLWNMKQNSERWQVLRYNNLYHNTLSFNGEFQIVDSSAPILSYANSPKWMNAVVDFSNTYRAQVSKAIRGIALVNRNYVVVRDELQTSEKMTKVRWAMLTAANVKIINSKEAELTKDGKKLILRVQEPFNIQLKTWSTAPETTYDAPNPGTVMLGFETLLPAKTSTALSVLLIPQAQEKKAIPPTKPISQWEKTLIH